MVRVYMAVASIPGRVHTVKEIYASVNCFQNIHRSSDSHQISRFMIWKMGNNCIQDPVHLFMRFTDCQSANRISIQIQF